MLPHDTVVWITTKHPNPITQGMFDDSRNARLLTDMPIAYWVPDGFQNKPCLRLTYSRVQNSVGIVAGRDTNVDIHLPNLLYISRQHFYINFDDEHRPFLCDTSQSGIGINYVDLRSNLVRDEARCVPGCHWPLMTPRQGTHVIALTISFSLRLILIVQDVDTKSALHKQNVMSFWDSLKAREPNPSYNGEPYQGAITRNNGSYPATGTATSSIIRTTAETTAPSRQPQSDDRPLSINLYLGMGGYGSVWLIWNINTHDSYVLKTPHKERFDETSWADWDYEASIMSTVDHKHIVKFLGTASYNDPGHPDPSDEKVHPGLKFEYVRGGSLDNYSTGMSTAQWFQVLSQLLSALKYLHGRKLPLVHRDIKPQNILVSSKPDGNNGMEVKFADFGLAKAAEEYSSVVGTPGYAAPEITDGPFRERTEKGRQKVQIRYTPAVDIFSLGCVISLEYEKSSREGRLLDFVREHMLVNDPTHRKSASECYRLLQENQASILSS